MPSCILNLSCPDRMGIVHAVARCLLDAGCNILDSAQYGDPETRRFFMRVHFAMASSGTVAGLESSFAEVAAEFAMRWRIFDDTRRPRVLILVSREDHCLQELLYRWRSGSLHMDEGPIIEQDVVRVDHNATPKLLVERGRDVERLVLARAVRLHLERRVLINGRKTVVFS